MAGKYCAESNATVFNKILKSKNVGLLVNERLVNMPADIVPTLHTQLPEDLAFTRKQDDIKNPREFNYDYLLVLSKFSVPNACIAANPDRKERLHYRWEDDVFERDAEVSFCYQSTFKEMAEDGTKSYIQGTCAQAGGGAETQYRIVYLISWKNYEKRIDTLAGYIKKK